LPPGAIERVREGALIDYRGHNAEMDEDSRRE
jgi:hypothetical protein